MSKKKRYYRYEVTEVFDGWEGRLKVGQTIIDTYHGYSHTYQTIDLDAEAHELPLKAVYSVKLVGEVTEQQILAQLESR